MILAVPRTERQLRGRQMVRNLSRHARRALEMSAGKSGVRLAPLAKAENGAPLPAGGWHWSVTHKRRYVAGVVSRKPVGIDLERIKPCSGALYRKIAGPAEWALGKGEPQQLFFRFWTAKEAVLKAAGVGLSELSKCRIEAVVNGQNLMVTHRGRGYPVAQFFFDGHIASATGVEESIEWETASRQ